VRIIYIQGDLYYGNVKNGKRDGEGSFISKEYNYTGTWTNDNLTGVGTKTLANGTVVKGYFNNGDYSMSENMYKLIQIFAKTPSGSVLPKEVIAKWKELGPLDLAEPMSSGKLSFNDLNNVLPLININ